MFQAQAKKTAVNPATVKRLSVTTSTLHKDYSQLKMLATTNMNDLKKMIKQVRTRPSIDDIAICLYRSSVVRAGIRTLHSIIICF